MLMSIFVIISPVHGCIVTVVWQGFGWAGRVCVFFILVVLKGHLSSCCIAAIQSPHHRNRPSLSLLAS